MAANVRKEVELALSVTTANADGIDNLKDQIVRLSKEAGEASPVLDTLAAELGALADQSAQVTGLADLSAKLAAVTASQKSAADTADALRAKYESLVASTDAAKVAQAAAKEALDLGKRATAEAGDAIKALKNETDSAGKQTVEYRNALQNAVTAQLESKKAVRDLADAYAATKEETLAARDAQAKATPAYREANTALESTNKTLEALKTQLDAAKAAFTEAGGNATDLGLAQQKIQVAFTDTKLALRGYISELDAAAKAEADQAFEAQRLSNVQRQAAADYETWWREALTSKEEYTKQATATEIFEGERLSALQKQYAAEYEKWWQDALLSKESNAKKADSQQVFDIERLSALQKAAAAEYEQWWRDALTAKDALAEKEASKRAFDTQRQSALDRAAAADYEQWWREALTAKEAFALKTESAMRTLGIRSATELRAEVLKVQQAYEYLQSTGAMTGAELNAAMNKAKASVNALERELRGVEGQLTLADKAAKLFSGSMAQFSAGAIIANGVQYLFQKIVELGQGFLDTNIKLESLRRGLTSVFGNAETAASQIDLLRKAANTAGSSVNDLSGAFVKYSAAMKGANIPLAESNALFESLTRASGILGLSSDATSRALEALGQTASKSTVSMEELRGQLGDALPGALGLAAKGLGITEAQLIKLVESGGLATRDFIVPMTRALNTLQGEVDGLAPAFKRFTNALTLIAQGIGDAGAIKLLTGALKVFGGVVGSVALGVSVLVEGLFLFGSSVVAVYGAIRGDRGALDYLAEQLAKSQERTTAQARALVALAVGAEETQAPVTALATKVLNLADNTDAASASARLHAFAIETLGDATLDAGTKVVQLNLATAEYLETAKKQIDAAEKNAKAVEVEGQSTVKLIALRGDLTQTANAELAAIEKTAAALLRSAELHQSETDALRNNIRAIEETAKARNLTAAELANETEKLRGKLVISQAETLQSIAAATAAKEEAFARSLAVAALADNSAKLEVYKAAVVALTERVLFLRDAQKAGLDVTAELLDADRKLTESKVLLADAVKDAVLNTELETKAKTASIQLSIAQAEVGKSHYESLAKQALAMRDTAMATYYEIEAKREQIKTIQLKLSLDKLVSDAALLEIELKRKLIDTTTEEGQIKLKILEIEGQIIKVKQTAAASQLDVIRGIEAEITALRLGTNARAADTQSRDSNTVAIDKGSAALEREIAAQEKANELKAKAIALENERLKQDANKFALNTDGQVATQQVESRTSVKASLIQQGVDPMKAAQLANNLVDGNGNFAYKSSGVYQQGDTTSAVIQKLAQQNQGTGTTEGAGSSKTVNINIGGRTTAIKVASQSDSDALVGLLRQIETASTRA